MMRDFTYDFDVEFGVMVGSTCCPDDLEITITRILNCDYVESEQTCVYQTSLHLKSFLPGGDYEDYFTFEDICKAIEEDTYDEAIEMMSVAFGECDENGKAIAKELGRYIRDEFDSEDSWLSELYNDRIEDIKNGYFKVDDQIKEKLISDGKLPKA